MSLKLTGHTNPRYVINKNIEIVIIFISVTDITEALKTDDEAIKAWIGERKRLCSLTVKMMYRNILTLEAPKAHYLDFEKIPVASRRFELYD